MAEQTDIQQQVRALLQTLDTPADEDHQHQDDGAEERDTPPVEGGDTQHYYLVTREELEQLANPKPAPTVIEAGTTTSTDEKAPSDTTVPSSDATQTITSETPEQQEQQIAEEVPPQPVPATRKVRRSYILVALLLLCILAAGSLTYLFVLPLTATADVTIVPTANTIHKEVTLPIATTPNAKGVQGRILESVSLSNSTVVSATGHAHEDAVRATGVITVYNADSQSYTIPAGVTFQVNGVDIVTDASVTVQAAIPPSFGVAIAPAHAIEPGITGNIPARSIYTRCCGSPFLTATNVTPFTGGRDARDYSYVQSSDIQNATNTLLPPLTSKVTAALTRELHAGENIVTPLCTPRTLADRDPGEEATQVKVSVVETCKSVSYDTTSLQTVATTLLVSSQKLDHFKQVGTTELTITKAATDGRSARLTVSITGSWVYSFSSTELTHFKKIIAGQPQQRATELLQGEKGVAQVTVSLLRLDFRTVLPTDPGKITIHFFYLVS
jgi:hypothetical protein